MNVIISMTKGIGDEMNNKSLIIAGARGCNCKCAGCYQNFGFEKAISTDELMSFVNEYVRAFEPSKITLAGGDPLTRPDILELVDRISALNVKINMDTAGKPLIADSAIIFHDTGIAKKVDAAILAKKINKIGIPVDGSSTKMINHFRKGITLDEIEKILTVLDEVNATTCINTVVNKENIDHLEEIYDVIKCHSSVVEFQLFEFQPTGLAAYKNRKLYEITSAEFDAAVESLIQAHPGASIRIQGKNKNQRKSAYVLVNTDGNVWTPAVTSGTDFVAEDACPEPLVIGNIKDKDIIDRIRNYVDEDNYNDFSIKHVRKAG